MALQPSDSLRMTTIESLGIPTVSISIQPRRLDPFPAFVLDSFFFVSVVLFLYCPKPDQGEPGMLLTTRGRNFFLR